MRREIWLYGIVGGLLIVILKLVEFRFLVIENNLEVYGGIVALIFTGLGVYFGIKFTKTIETVVLKEVLINTGQPFSINTAKLDELGITAREFEILGLISEGLSNKEIGERLYISENTVKTHSSRLFEKLNAKRRMQAVLISKTLGLIP